MSSIRKTKKNLKREIIKECKKFVYFLIQYPEDVNRLMPITTARVIRALEYKLQQLKRKKNE